MPLSRKFKLSSSVMLVCFFSYGVSEFNISILFEFALDSIITEATNIV